MVNGPHCPKRFALRLPRYWRNARFECLRDQDGRALELAARHTPLSDEDFSNCNSGVAFKVEETRRARFADSLRFRREIGSNKNRSGAGGKSCRAVAQFFHLLFEADQLPVRLYLARE